MSKDSTCYIERSAVRAILIAAPEIDSDATGILLMEIDALPISIVSDFIVPLRPAVREVLEKIDQIASNCGVDKIALLNSLSGIRNLARAALSADQT